MLYAVLNGLRVLPSKGAKALCPCCNGQVVSVISESKVHHWRHKAKKHCDQWWESETMWHREWKACFPENCREVPMTDLRTGEKHIADVCRMALPEGRGVVLELQHSSISLEERTSRENYYMRQHDLFWLLHLHDEGAFYLTAFSLAFAVGYSVHIYNQQQFLILRWGGRSSAFIEKWKNSAAHIVFDANGRLFYLVKKAHDIGLQRQFQKAEFAVLPITKEQLIAKVVN